MSIVEKITGWKPIVQEEVHPGVLKIYSKKYAKKTRKYKRDIPKQVIYVNGNTFKYKIVEPKRMWHSNHGHGGYMCQGFTKFYRKLR